MLPILSIKQFDTKISEGDFYSNHLEKHLVRNKNIIHKAHKHDFFLCVLFTSGTGSHNIDFNVYDIKAGSLFFLKPGQTHSWEFTSQPKGFIFFHTEDFYDCHFSNHNLSQYPFYFSHTNPPFLNVKQAALADISQQFKAINTEHGKEGAFKNQKIASLITALYIDISRLYTDYSEFKMVSSVTALDIIEKLEQSIERYYRTHKSASFYASKLNISPKHLNRVTRATINKTTTEVIAERVILEAKRLIVHTFSSLNDIAISLGFEDYAYFSKVFKQKTNSTPIDFRKRHQIPS